MSLVIRRPDQAQAESVQEKHYVTLIATVLAGYYATLLPWPHLRINVTEPYRGNPLYHPNLAQLNSNLFVKTIIVQNIEDNNRLPERSDLSMLATYDYN